MHIGSCCDWSVCIAVIWKLARNLFILFCRSGNTTGSRKIFQPTFSRHRSNRTRLSSTQMPSAKSARLASIFFFCTILLRLVILTCSSNSKHSFKELNFSGYFLTKSLRKSFLKIPASLAWSLHESISTLMAIVWVILRIESLSMLNILC